MKHRIGGFCHGEPRIGAAGIVHVMAPTSAFVSRVNLSHIHEVFIHGFLQAIKELLQESRRVFRGGIRAEIIELCPGDEGVDV